MGWEYQNSKEDSEHLVQQPAEPPSKCPNTDLGPRSHPPPEGQESYDPQEVVISPTLENHWSDVNSTPVAPSTGTGPAKSTGRTDREE